MAYPILFTIPCSKTIQFYGKPFHQFWWSYFILFLIFQYINHKSGYPQIINFNNIFYCQPSILGYPHIWKPPYVYHCLPCWTPASFMANHFINFDYLISSYFSLSQYISHKWGYPKIIYFNRIFYYKPSSQWVTPIDGNPQIIIHFLDLFLTNSWSPYVYHMFNIVYLPIQHRPSASRLSEEERALAVAHHRHHLPAQALPDLLAAVIPSGDGSAWDGDFP